MPKPKNKYDLQHQINVVRYQQMIDSFYDEAVREAVAIGSIAKVDVSVPFTFEHYPITKQRINTTVERLRDSIKTCVVNGVMSEWTLANNKNNELCNMVFGDNIGKLTQAQYRRYYSTNEAARDAFLARKINGFDLSENVWR